MTKLIGSLLAVAVLAAPAYAGGKKHQHTQKQPEIMGEAPQLPKKVKNEIQATFDKFEQAWSQHDAGQLASHFATEGRLINPLGEGAAGRENLQRFFRSEHEGPLKDTKAELTVQNGRMIGKEMALIDLNIEIEGMRTPQGEQLPMQTMHGVAVLTRQKDGWKILEARGYQYLDPQRAGVGGAGEQEGIELEPLPQPQPEEPGPVY